MGAFYYNSPEPGRDDDEEHRQSVRFVMKAALQPMNQSSIPHVLEIDPDEHRV